MNNKSLRIVTVFFGILCFASSAVACTTILVGKNLTADGSVMMAHTEDMDPDDVGRIYQVQHKEHAANETLWLPWETLPQPSVTYRYWAIGNWNKDKYDGDILDGINENGVGMACNAIWSKGPHIEGRHGLKRYSLRQLILDRSKSARDGVDVIADLIAKYGQGNTEVMDIAYCLIDQKECWVVEATAHNWVAKRVPDDGYLVWSNEICIEDNWDLASPEIMEKTNKNGGKKVNFKKEYGLYGDNDVGIGLLWNTARKARAEQLMKDCNGKVTVPMLLRFMRDHYEGTDKAHKPIHGDDYYTYPAKNPRPICTNESQELLIFQMKDGLPPELGAKVWIGPSTPCITSVFPLYAGTMSIPISYTISEQMYSLKSAWWKFESLQRLADKDYEKYINVIRDGWAAYEERIFDEASAAEARASKAFDAGKNDEGRALLTSFTIDAMNAAENKAMTILERLIGLSLSAPISK
ncbi:MAG: C69 family dipeptidase [Pyramidobacter sp.]